MRVPKMVKNGHNSVLHIFGSYQENQLLKEIKRYKKKEGLVEVSFMLSLSGDDYGG